MKVIFELLGLAVFAVVLGFGLKWTVELIVDFFDFVFNKKGNKRSDPPRKDEDHNVSL